MDFDRLVLSRFVRFASIPYSHRHDHSSSGGTSRYFHKPNSLSARYLSLAATSMSADLEYISHDGQTYNSYALFNALSNINWYSYSSLISEAVMSGFRKLLR